MQNSDRPLVGGEGSILITGASGHIGTSLCRALRADGQMILPTDVQADPSQGVLACNLTVKDDVSGLFQLHQIRAVIHLAGLLPSAFRSDPLRGAEVNLNGSFELLRQAVNAGVKRFVFASSISVYGSSSSARPLTENDPATPDDPYGASKRAVELIGEALASRGAIEFVSLRIARVIGPGIKRSASPWRSQIFEPLLLNDLIQIPFAPEAILSLVHVQDVAQMLVMLENTTDVRGVVYNTPVELWLARDLKQLIEKDRNIQIELGQDGALAGPACDGSRFVREFGIKLQGLRTRLTDRPPSD